MMPIVGETLGEGRPKNPRRTITMKTKLLPLLAVPVLLGACSSLTQNTAQLPKTPAPIRIADRDSAWGERPSYDPKGQYFIVSFKGPPAGRDMATEGAGHSGIATVDVLVGRDGTVEDVVIASSSGDKTVDNAAMRICRNSRYSLQLGHDDPAPYVVSQKVGLKITVTASSRNSSGNGISNTGPLPTYTEYSGKYTAPDPPNTVNGFIR
jgi:TonB family protein